MQSGRVVPSTTSREMTTSSTPSRPGRSNMVSSRMLSRIERGPRAPVLRSIALRATTPRPSSAKVRSMFSILNNRWYCFTNAFLGSVRIFFSEVSSRFSSVTTTGRRPTNSGIRPYLIRSSGSTWRKISPLRRSSGANTCAAKPIEVERPRAEMIFSSPEKAPPRMNRMFVCPPAGTPAADACDRPAVAPKPDLQQRLLHALARHVAGDRGVVGLADLVDLVDVDDAALRALDIVIGRPQQLQDDVLDVLADVAGFGQRRRVRHRERHVEDARQRLHQQRLARAGRTGQQHVGLRQVDVVLFGLVLEPLVVIVDSDRQHLLGMALADHVIVQHLADFLRGRNAVASVRAVLNRTARGSER